MQATQHSTSSGTQTKSNIDPGDYIGYTLGGSEPTLYFRNGHLTQDHDSKNKGWHPIHDLNKYGFGNITAAAAKEFEDMDDDPTKLNDFLSRFSKGQLNGEHNDDALLFEYSTSPDDPWTHLSRGKLMRLGDKKFDDRFGQSYARKQMENAVLASNEVK